MNQPRFDRILTLIEELTKEIITQSTPKAEYLELTRAQNALQQATELLYAQRELYRLANQVHGKARDERDAARQAVLRLERPDA